MKIISLAFIVGFAYSVIKFLYSEAKKKSIAPSPELENQQQEQAKAMQKLYEEKKKEYIKYFEIFNKASPLDFGAEESWDALLESGLSMEEILSNIKGACDEIFEARKEYDDCVNTDWSTEGVTNPDEKQFIEDIKKQFDKKYRYNNDYLVSYIEAYKSIISELRRKKATYVMLKERGVNSVELSILEEMFLIDATEMVADLESRLEKGKQKITESNIQSELQNLRNIQEEQLDKIEQLNQKSNVNKGIFGF